MASFYKRTLAVLRAKLASARGETLVETLVATLIMGLVMLMLCTAIVSAAKINATAKASDITFDQGAAIKLDSDTTVTVTTPRGGSVEMRVDDPEKKIVAYTQNGFVYYEPYKAPENN